MLYFFVFRTRLDLNAAKSTINSAINSLGFHFSSLKICVPTRILGAPRESSLQRVVSSTSCDGVFFHMFPPMPGEVARVATLIGAQFTFIRLYAIVGSHVFPQIRRIHAYFATQCALVKEFTRALVVRYMSLILRSRTQALATYGADERLLPSTRR